MRSLAAVFSSAHAMRSMSPWLSPSRRPMKRMRTPSASSSGVSGSMRSEDLALRPSTSSRLAELQRAVRVPVHEHALDGDLVGGVSLDEFGHVSVDCEQPAGHLALADADAAARDVADALAAGVHHAVTRDSRPGIEAEDTHHGSYDSDSP